MTITLYISSVSSNLVTKKNIQTMMSILDSKSIPHDVVDVATQPGTLKEMREKMGDDKAVIPQLFVDDRHVGGWDEFFSAVEDEELNAFLGL
eukprot:m.59884 g.59884  ORF g.59884 m.59884 type:complete len:92 (-) comp7925_c0_seq8:2446-2721(-)